MLIKQGLFSKRESNAKTHMHRTEADEAVYVTPGHLAAIKSAVLVQSELNEVYLDDDNVSLEIEKPVLTVGKGMQLECSAIDGCYQLVVEGNMRCNVECQHLQVSETGGFTGQVKAAHAEIFGEFHGSLFVEHLLVVHPTATVTGHIRYGQIRVIEGGSLSGDIAKLTEDSPLKTITTH